MKILLLEDDVILSEIIEEFLIELGYEVVVCFDGNEAEDNIYSASFDLFLFDVNVPYINGLELLKSLREIDNNTPTIFITSLNTSTDLENGFSAGGDDYIKKPFELKELELRINNIKRMYNIETNDVVKIDTNITLNMQSNMLNCNNNQIQLAKKEADVLKYFIKNKNKIISIDELTINVWNYDEAPSSATVRTYIKNIRKNIGAQFITNIKGLGYKFN